MEVNEDGFLEELLSLGRSDTLEIDGFFTTNWDLTTFQENISPYDPSPILPNLDCSFSELYEPFDVKFTSSNILNDIRSYQNHSYTNLETPSFPNQEDYSMSVAEVKNVQRNVEMAKTTEIQGYNMGLCMERKNKKKSGGQPSKNLMAERRRRKRLNDRLLMLRSVVPKISKMDRASILGDTIDYMKELLEKINSMQREIDVNSNEMNGIRIINGQKQDDVLRRTTAKFDVERRKADTLVEISCTGKSGLLLSTISTLEALGQEIQQCVISCFNDFSLHASCSKELEIGTKVSSEDIKQELFRNAGYGGRCP